MAVVFDFNGTMIFDGSLQEKAWREYIGKKIDRTVSDDEFVKYIHGRNAEFTLEYFLKKSLTRQEVEALEEEKEVIYRKLCMTSPDFKLVPGLEAFLDELVEEHIPINIATASGLNNLKFFFEELDLDRWFDMGKVVYNDGTCKGKPEPDMYLKAAERIGVDIKDTYVFEDSMSGIESARRAGARGIIKVSENKTVEEKSQANLIITTYEGLTLQNEGFIIS